MKVYWSVLAYFRYLLFLLEYLDGYLQRVKPLIDINEVRNVLCTYLYMFLSIRWRMEKWVVERGVVLLWNVYSLYFLGFIGARKSEAGLWSTVEWRHFPWMACKWKDKWSVIYTIHFDKIYMYMYFLSSAFDFFFKEFWFILLHFAYICVYLIASGNYCFRDIW